MRHKLGATRIKGILVIKLSLFAVYFTVNWSVRVMLGSNCNLFSPSVTVGTLQFNVKKGAINEVNIQIC